MKQLLKTYHLLSRKDFGDVIFTYGLIMLCFKRKLLRIFRKLTKSMRELLKLFLIRSLLSASFGLIMRNSALDVTIQPKPVKYLESQQDYSLNKKFLKLIYQFRSNLVNWTELECFTRSTARNLLIYLNLGSNSQHSNYN